MSLSGIIEAIGDYEKDLTVVNCDDEASLLRELREYFRAQNVRISGARTASGRPAGIAVLGNRGRVLSIVTVETLRSMLEGVPAGPDTVGIADGAYESILGHLKETTFTSYDTEQMLYASREIEDRARRTGTGTIHAGFQRLETLADQRSIYADLAARGLDVHVYGTPDGPVPEIDATVHASDADEIARTWFVVFDGGGIEAQQSALLAEERDEGRYYGAWTYDPAIVEAVLDHLETTYLSADRRSTSPDH